MNWPHLTRVSKHQVVNLFLKKCFNKFACSNNQRELFLGLTFGVTLDDFT